MRLYDLIHSRGSIANLAYKAWYAIIHPVFTFRIFLVRLAFLFTRRFCGPTLRSPEGEIVFNVQSLINHWAMYVIFEMGRDWQQHIRETVTPSIWDVGANIGQFGRMALSLNPGCKVTAIDPWPGMDRYNTHAKFIQAACGNKTGPCILTRSNGGGWTGSTKNGFYDGEAIDANMVRLDDIWDGNQVDLLKIDVDGAEKFVLDGAVKMIEKTKIIIIEVNGDDVMDCLPLCFQWSTINGHDWIGIRSPWHSVKTELSNTKPFRELATA